MSKMKNLIWPNLHLCLLFLTLHLLLMTNCVLREQFDFTESSFDQGDLSWEENGIKIKLEDLSQFDSEHSRIRIDRRYQANITGVLDHSPTYEYYIGMWVYNYEPTYAIMWFCLSLKAQFIIGDASCDTECEVYWCIDTYIAGTTGGQSEVYYTESGTNKTYKAYQSMPGINSGWQYFGFYHQAYDGVGLPDYTSTDKHQIFKFTSQDHDSTLQSFVLSINPASLADEGFGFPKLGYRIFNGARDRQFVGLVSKFTIHDSIPSTDEVASRQDVVDMIDTYSYYWDFSQTANTLWYKDRLSNQGYDYQGVQTDKYFLTSTPAQPPYPSNKGWVLTVNTVSITSEELNLDGSPQFTFEFETYTYGGGYYFGIKIYQDEIQAATLPDNYEAFIYFSYYGIAIRHWSTLFYGTPNSGWPWFSPYFPLASLVWNKIYISWQLFNDSNQVKICYYVRQMTCETCTQYAARQFCHIRDANKFLLNYGKMVVSFESMEMMLRNFKFYKYAINAETAMNDLAVNFPTLSDDDYEFTQNFNQKYKSYAYVTAPYIKNEDNACMNYISPNTLCRDLDQNIASNCKAYNDPPVGSSYLFCMETCGDGYLEMNPQVYQCDDGNTDTGDGCNEHCMFEEGFDCFTSSKGVTYCAPNCSNGKNDPGEECDDGNANNGDGCSDACTVEEGFGCNTDLSPSFCFPSCGDGKRENDEECDDGNNIGYDGCDNDCKKEYGYTCKPNPSLGKDVCIPDFFPPVVLDFKINTFSNEAIFVFNDTMKSFNFTEDDIIMSASGPNQPYSFSYSASFSKNDTLKIKYSVTPLIIGGMEEVLEIILFDVDKFVSKDLIPLSGSVEFTYYYSSEPSAEAEATGSGASYSYLLTIIVSVGVSLLTGGSMELMWSMTNTLQIIYNMSLLKLYFYPDLLVMLKYMSYSNFDNPLAGYVTSYVVEGAALIPLPEGGKFDGTHFDSSNILANALDKLFMIVLLLLFMLMFYFLSKCMKNKSHCVAKMVRTIDMRLRYESTCRFLSELSLHLFIVAILDITYDRDSSTVNIIGYVCSILLLLLLLTALVYSIVYPMIKFKHIKVYPDHNERHCFLFLDFKNTHVRCYLYYGYFLTRRLGLALVFICLIDFPHVQCTCLVVLCSWITNYHFTYKPFRSQIINFLTCVNELTLMLFCCVLYGFISNSNPLKIVIFGYVGVGVLVVFFLINWTVIFCCKFGELLKKCKRCCSKEEKKIKIKVNRSDIQLARANSANNIANLDEHPPVIIERYRPQRSSAVPEDPDTHNRLHSPSRPAHISQRRVSRQETKVGRRRFNPIRRFADD